MGAEDRTGQPSRRALWTDRLGRLGIRSGQLILIIGLVAAVIYAAVQLKLLVIPILISVILAAAISPLVRWLRRRGLSPMLATWTTLLAGVVILGGIVVLIVLAVRDQWDELARAGSEGLDELGLLLREGPIPIDQAQLDTARETAVDFITSNEFGTGAIAGVYGAAEGIAGVLLGLVILFYLLKDGDQIWEFFLRPLEGTTLERMRRIGDTAPRVLGGYVRGTAIIALFDAVFIGVGLAILQVPLALPLAVIVFLTAFIPMVGATIAGILAALVALVANGPVVALIVVAIVIVVNQLEGDLLQPIVMGQSLNLHPLVILLALTGGTILGGIAGAVLAVPITAVTWAIIKVWDGPDDNAGRASPRPRRKPRANA